ncbi:hypothetical protein [Burkholderia pyrrocinia]|uniref:Uncharacterized protein n=1 Tax=Burkholderia pyrrocinia TaxID=60550 RepID=A0ABZ3BP97_BURPY
MSAFERVVNEGGTEALNEHRPVFRRKIVCALDRWHERNLQHGAALADGHQSVLVMNSHTENMGYTACVFYLSAIGATARLTALNGRWT